MIILILLGLALHLLYVFTPAVIYLPAEGIIAHAGSRDNGPDPSNMVMRARRALANWMENLPLFAVPAVLVLIVPSADTAMAALGAQIFLVSRLLYLPLYLISIPFLRSAAYVGGLAGNVMIVMALL